jgi:hypothetical protein
MQNFFHPRDDETRSRRLTWIVGGGFVLVALLFMPAYIDTLAVQLFESEIVSTFCGYIGITPGGK